MFHYKIILFLIQNETANGDSNVDFKRENSNTQALLCTEAKEACEHFQVQGYLRPRIILFTKQ